jgi:hypothetical protein
MNKLTNSRYKEYKEYKKEYKKEDSLLEIPPKFTGNDNIKFIISEDNELTFKDILNIIREKEENDVIKNNIKLFTDNSYIYIKFDDKNQ